MENTSCVFNSDIGPQANAIIVYKKKRKIIVFLVYSFTLSPSLERARLHVQTCGDILMKWYTILTEVHPTQKITFKNHIWSYMFMTTYIKRFILSKLRHEISIYFRFKRHRFRIIIYSISCKEVVSSSSYDMNIYIYIYDHRLHSIFSWSILINLVKNHHNSNYEGEIDLRVHSHRKHIFS